MSEPTALIVGGTGPTGPLVVNGLRQRGYAVTILHTGRHESDQNPTDIVHIHADPFDEAATADVLAGLEFDLAVVMYGRLRVLVRLLEGKVGRIITIGGVGAVRGWVDPRDLMPSSMTVPAPSDALLAPVDEPIGKIRRIVETEHVVFEHHPNAIHLRYPMLYGPRQLIPREWPLIKRALDKRPALILADGGLTLKSAAFIDNAAHAVMCAVDNAETGAGNIYNVTDDRALTLRQIAELIADELGHSFEFISMPYELAKPARPLVMHWSTGHRVVSTDTLRRDLAYSDVVEPEEGIRRTARWLVDNPPTHGMAARLQDPFDYVAEDELIRRWQRVLAEFVGPTFASEPGYGAAYYGRDPNPATGTSRIEPV